MERSIDTMFNFSEMFSWNSERFPEKVAILFEGKEITYRKLNELATWLSNSIIARGGKVGDRVAILLFNQPEFYYSAIGANRAGLVFLPLNYRLAREELRYILSDSGARFLVTESQFRNQIDLIRESLSELKTCLMVDKGNPPEEGWESFYDFLEAGRNSQASQRYFEAGPDDIHRLMYTSGTTANPKGVIITYSNMWWKTFAHVIDLQTTQHDIALVAGPLYHVGAFDLAAAHVLLSGGSLVMLRKFDAKECLKVIEKYKITVIWLAPSMLNLILQSEGVESHDLTSVRVIIDGGEKMPEPLITKLLSVFKNAWYADAYGLTETVSGDTFLPKKYVKEKLGSVGKPTLFVRLKIVDDSGNELPNGTDGLITLKGPKVFRGYWNNEEATRNVLKEDGWFYTGDVGHLDQDGFLYITDRKKDMIKSGGENISSLEVERVLYQIPDVQEVAVVGMEDDTWGEVPVAFVVARKGKTLSEKALTQFCADKIARFKTPKKFIIQEEPLPRNPSGKVLKRVLRERTNPANPNMINAGPSSIRTGIAN